MEWRKIQTKKVIKMSINFGQNGQILGKKAKNLVIYDFLKEHRKTCLHIKNYEKIIAKRPPKGQILAIMRIKKF